jgi:hypothetical protein
VSANPRSFLIFEKILGRMLLKKIYWLLAISAILGFVACDDDNDTSGRPNRGESFLRVVNASNQLAMVDVYAQYQEVKTILAPNLASHQPFPDSLYLRMEPTRIPLQGENQFWYRLFAHAVGDTNPVFSMPSLALTDSIRLAQDAYQTLFLFDSIGFRKFVLLIDPSLNRTSLQDSASLQVRFVNLGTRNQHRLEWTSNNPGGASTLPVGGLVASRAQTAMVTAPSGSVTLSVFDQDDNLIHSRNIQVAGRSAVTVYFDGQQVRWYYM